MEPGRKQQPKRAAGDGRLRRPKQYSYVQPRIEDMTAYEVQRMRTMEANQKRLQELGIPQV